MEQPNMMQNGMQAQMQQQQLNAAAMQRPQPGNINQQIFAKIVNDLKNQIGQFAGGWQATLDPRTRASLIMQLITALRMLDRDIPKCMLIAQKFEHTSITNAQNKQQYEQSMQAKLEEIKQRREQNTAQMMRNGPMNGGMQQQQQSLGNMNNQPRGMMQPQQQQQQQHQLGNMNNAGQTPNFPMHLQRPMQPTMLQPPTTMDPSFLMQSQASPQFPMGMGSAGNDMQDMNQNNAQQDLSLEVQQTAQHLMASMPEAKKTELRKQLYANMSEQQRQLYNSRSGDPLKSFVIQKARQDVVKRKSMSGQGLQMPQQQNNQQNGQFNPNGQLGLGGLNNLGQQMNGQQSGNFSLSQLYGQQANALKMQESGEQVVPVSDNALFSNAGANNQNNNAAKNNPLNMLGNGLGQQNAQGAQAGNVADAQRLLLQQQSQKQLQDRMINHRNNLARNRALDQQRQAGAQGNPLSGQPGGLNPGNAFMGGPLNSPAMPTLNRPLQASNDQQNFGLNGMQNFSPFPGGDANALAQHHQNMINQNNVNATPNQGQGVPPNQVLGAILNKLEPNVRNKILAMPHNEKIQALTQLKMNGMQSGQNRAMPNQAMAPQNPNMTQNNLLSLLPNGQQPQGLAGNPQQMGDMQRQRQQQMIKGQAMMSRPLPHDISNILQIPIPPGVQRWGQLRSHINQNANLMPPHMQQRVMQAMERHFQQNPAELQQGMQDVIAQHQQQLAARNAAAAGGAGGPGHAGPNVNMNMNNGQFMNQANGMQMTPPVAMMQPTPQQPMSGNQNMPIGMLPQVSPQEIAQLRAVRKLGPNITDDQIRSAMMQQRMKMMQNKQSGHPTGQAPQLDQQTNNLGANQNRPQPSNRTPMQANASQQAANMKQAQQNGKRPAPVNDDVVEIPNPNAATKKPPLPADIRQMLPEQLAKLPKEQQLKIQQHLAGMQKFAQGGQAAVQPQQAAVMGGTNPRAQGLTEHKMLLSRLWAEIGAPAAKGGPVKVEASQVNELKGLFRKMWKPLQALEQSLATAYRIVPGFNDDQAKSLLRAKAILMQNISDEDGGIRGHLSASSVQLKQLGEQIMRYYAELSRNTPKKPGMPTEGQVQRGAATAVSTTQQQQQQAQSAAPAMAATKSQQNHARKASNNSKPPSAPIDEKKFWPNVSSPHGVPKYDSQKPELTPDQLKMPNKKRKTGPATSQPTTPAQVSTPGATVTPKLPAGKIGDVVKAAPKAVETEKQRWKCHEDLCNASINGFETEAQLKAHEGSAHAPIEDPLKFLLDVTADIIKADEAVTASKKSAASKAKAQANAVAKVSLLKQTGKATKPVVGTANKTAEEDDKTLREVLSEKMGYPAMPAEVTPADGDTLMTNIGDLCTDFDDLDTFDSFGSMAIDDWGLDIEASSEELLDLSPPELTPEGTDSSRNSDISNNDQLRLNLSWDAFGNGDDHVPDFLKIGDKTIWDFTSSSGAMTKQDSKVPVGDEVTAGEKSSNKDEVAAGTEVSKTSSSSSDQWDWSKDVVDWGDMLNTSDPLSGESLWDDGQMF